jgi:hypothetical protein
MPCYHPISGWRTIERTESGKRGFTTSPVKGYLDMPLTIPCGQCIGCRLEKSRQWAIRCVYEAQGHDQNCFITLTYDQKHLPKDHSLHLEDFQKFMKRLRRRFSDLKIKMYHCGEYGENFSRPHYHACLFGFDFPDKELYRNDSENPLYTSEICNEIWGKGYTIIGKVTFDSAAYVARYITKKINKKEEDYTRINFIDSKVLPVKPEYATMSRNGGIGRDWFEKFKDDVYPHDYVVLNGKKMKPPKFFDKLLDDQDHFEYLRVKEARKDVSDDFKEENTYDRLIARKKFKELQMKKCLERKFENGIN